MTEPDPEALVAFRELVGDARVGSLSVKLDPSEFHTLLEACETFKGEIGKIQRTIKLAGDGSVSWGLGEDNTRLGSAVNLVEKYRKMASGPDNSLHSVLEEHYKVASEIQTMFQVIRDDYIRTDEEFAAKWREMNTELEAGSR